MQAAKATNEVLKLQQKALEAEQIYAIVLTTYDDASSFGLSLNTHENHERIWQGVRSDPNASAEAYYKWFWGEWQDYEFIGDQSSLDAPIARLKDLQRLYSDEHFSDYRKALLSALEIALKQIQQSEILHLNQSREDIAYYVGIYDSFDTETVMAQTLTALNSPSLSNQVLEDWARQ